MKTLEDIYLEFEIIIYHLKLLCQQVIINIFCTQKDRHHMPAFPPFIQIPFSMLHLDDSNSASNCGQPSP